MKVCFIISHIHFLPCVFTPVVSLISSNSVKLVLEYSDFLKKIYLFYVCMSTLLAVLMVVSYHVVAGNLNSGPLFAPVSPAHYSLRMYLIISKYTVAVFRHTRRERQISLLMVVSHHVVAGN